VNALPDDAIGRLRAVANWPEFASDRYTVTREIGRGGMGSVYAAIDAELGREVALKVSNTVAGGAFEQRLAAEARVLARLEHPGIVPIHDVGRLADGRPFYVMKRIDGTTLTEHMRAPIELAERLRIFERICEAVAFAHARRILHRDLKPDNVMVGSYGEVMVMDWGVAKAMSPGDDERTMAEPPADVLGASTNHGTVLGTRGYMSPEQARGDVNDLDERADVYGLGAILRTLLSKDHTNESGTPVPASVADLKSIPGPLRSICARALAANPADRYPSAAALGEDVARFRAGQAVRAHRETGLEQVARFARTYRTPILLVLAYIVMRALVAFTTGR
jgi:eukaryotic-like serine/threonine-protein kinase